MGRYNITPGAEDVSTSTFEEKSIIFKIIKDLGGASFAVGLGDKALEALGCISKNKTYQKTIKTLRTALSFSVISYSVYASIKKFGEEKEERAISDREDRMVKELIGIKDKEAYTERTQIELGREIINWLLQAPRTKRFKILNFYDENFTHITATNNKPKVRILIEMTHQRVIMDINFIQIGNDYLPLDSRVYTINEQFDIVQQLKRDIFAEFVAHFDTEQNVILYKKGGLSIRKRQSVGHEIEQFSVDKWVDEVRRAMDKGKKRGYVFIGTPGNGKSLIQVDLEDKVREYPFVYVYNSAFTYEDDVTAAFDFFKSISPCIVIFEDLDSYGLQSKSCEFFNGFIEGLDSVRSESNVCFVGTLNDSSLVHYSLINRRGRFDRVFFIEKPKTNREIYHVMSCRYQKNNGNDIPLTQDELGAKFFEEAMGLDRSDICEIVDSLEILDMEFNIDNIMEKLEEVKNSKKALECCNFGGKDVDSDSKPRKLKGVHLRY